MKMRKLLSFMLAGVIVGTMAGCGSSSEEGADPKIQLMDTSKPPPVPTAESEGVAGSTATPATE